MTDRRSFPTTRWSVVLTAGAPDSPNKRTALASLCEAYWYPVYAFVRRSGRSIEDAQDLTQAFFARVLEKGYLGVADPHRGHFRSFLLAALKHFLANEWNHQHAQKRGGGQPLLSLEFDDGERRYQVEPVDDVSPDRIYERRWAMAVLDGTIRRVEQQYARDGRQRRFERLKPFLLDDGVTPYATVAEELEISEGSLRVAVHRLRRQFVATLRETTAETVENAADVDDELRYLLKAVNR